jgi:hypothetical protein
MNNNDVKYLITLFSLIGLWVGLVLGLSIGGLFILLVMFK